MPKRQKFLLLLVMLLVSAFILSGCTGDGDTENTTTSDEITESIQESQQESMEEEYSSVHDELINDHMITSELPSDFPIPGGKVTSFEEEELRTDLRIDTGSTPEDVYEWFEENLADTSWEIDDSEFAVYRGYFNLSKGEQKADISLGSGYGRQTYINMMFYSY